jgi:hypothetical protein
MTMNGTTEDTKTTDTKTPTRGESAVRHLWKRAIEEDRKADADLIAKVAILLLPGIKLTAGLPFETKKATVNTAEINGSEVDLSEMSDDDARAYAEYAAEMDGSARLARHIAQMEADDAEMAEIGRRNAG